MIGRWTDPLLIVKRGWRLSFGYRIAGPRELTAVPSMNGLQLAHSAVQDQLPQPFEIGIGVALRPVLRGDFVASLEVIGADRADFVHADAKRLLAVDMHVAIERP